MRAGMLASLQGVTARPSVRSPECVQDIFPYRSETLFSHLAFTGLASDSGTHSPSENRSQTLRNMSVSRSWPIVLESATDRDSRLLREFAEFWKVPYQSTTRNEGGSLVFTTQATHLPHGHEDTTIVASPSYRENFDEVVREYGLETTSKICLIHIPVGPSVRVSLRTEIHEFSGARVEPVLRAGEVTILSKIRGTRAYLLSVDLLGEYSKRIYGGIEERPSKRFWFASKLPFSYQAIPRFIRDRSFRSGQGLAEITEEKLSPVECLRTIFLASLVTVSGPIPKLGFCRNPKSSTLFVTHTVDPPARFPSRSPTPLPA